jgi:hypothetical protein
MKENSDLYLIFFSLRAMQSNANKQNVKFCFLIYLLLLCFIEFFLSSYDLYFFFLSEIFSINLSLCNSQNPKYSRANHGYCWQVQYWGLPGQLNYNGHFLWRFLPVCLIIWTKHSTLHLQQFFLIYWNITAGND